MYTQLPEFPLPHVFGSKEDIEQIREIMEMASVGVRLPKSRFHLACSYGQVAEVMKLIEEGADPGQGGGDGERSPLHDACVGGHTECVKILLQHLDNINMRDPLGQTPLHLAAYNGELKCLKLLVDKGANLVAEDKKGRQPSHLAAMRNQVKVVKVLFDHGVDLDSRCKSGKTPLHYTAQYGALDCMICLVERDCDTMMGDNSGFLAAHVAARYNKLDCLRFLIKQGTAINSIQADGKTPAHVASGHGSVEVLHWLYGKGADANSQDYFGNTPGHYAAEGGWAECLNCCLQHGGDLQVPSIRGDTVLDAAKKHGHPVLMDRAVKNEVPCPLCYKRYEKKEWERTHKPSRVERDISAAKATAFVSPLPPMKKTPSQLQRNKHQREQTLENQQKTLLPDRDLAAKFFGEHLDPNSNFNFHL